MSGFTILFLQALGVLCVASVLAFLVGRATAARSRAAQPVVAIDPAPEVPVSPPAAPALADPPPAASAPVSPLAAPALDPAETVDADIEVAEPPLAEPAAPAAPAEATDQAPAEATAEASAEATAEASGEMPAELAPRTVTVDAESPVFDAVAALQRGIAEVVDAAPTSAPDGGDATQPADPAGVESLLKAKDEEIGRLESGALTALERTITRFQGQVDDLKAQLHEATSRSRELDLRVQEETLRATRLETALSQRDETLAGLREELDRR